MTTECKPEQLEYQSLGRREVIGRFDGGRITSDGGGLLLREVDQRIGLLDRLAAWLHRSPQPREHRTQRAGSGGPAGIWFGAGLRRFERPR